MKNLMEPLLSNVVKLFQRVEAVQVHITVRANVKVHRLRRKSG